MVKELAIHFNCGCGRVTVGSNRLTAESKFRWPPLSTQCLSLPGFQGKVTLLPIPVVRGVTSKVVQEITRMNKILQLNISPRV